MTELRTDSGDLSEARVATTRINLLCLPFPLDHPRRFGNALSSATFFLRHARRRLSRLVKQDIREEI